MVPGRHCRHWRKRDAARELAARLLARAHKNTVIVALASKLARIAWAVLRQGGTYRGSGRDGRLIEIGRGASDPVTAASQLKMSAGGGSEMA